MNNPRIYIKANAPQQVHATRTPKAAQTRAGPRSTNVLTTASDACDKELTNQKFPRLRLRRSRLTSLLACSQGRSCCDQQTTNQWSRERKHYNRRQCRIKILIRSLLTFAQALRNICMASRRHRTSRSLCPFNTWFGDPPIRELVCLWIGICNFICSVFWQLSSSHAQYYRFDKPPVLPQTFLFP